MVVDRVTGRTYDDHCCAINDQFERH